MSSDRGGWPTREIEATVSLELTEKQIEALKAAAVLGWFEVPKESSSDDLSRYLKIGNSPATRRIRLAEREIVHSVVESLDNLCPLCDSAIEGAVSQHLPECPEGGPQR